MMDIRQILISFAIALAFGLPHLALSQTLLPQPQLALDGPVHSTAIDSQGRLIFGGGFSTVNGNNISGVARLRPNLTLDTTWMPVVSGAVAQTYVSAILVYKGTIYIGGSFTSVGGVSRNALAAFDEGTGILKAWNPNISQVPEGFVSAMAVVADTIYVAGNFHAVGTQQRNHLAALDPVSGIPTSWNPNADGPMFSMAASSDGTIYVAGNFGHLGFTSAPGAAALDAMTGLPSSWTFTADGQIYAIAPVGNRIYLGGNFTNIDDHLHPNLAMVDATTGADLPWNPQVDYEVRTIAPAGDVIYVAGGFASFDGQVRNSLAAFDAVSGQLNGWDAKVTPTIPSGGPSMVNSVFPNDGLVFIGGRFDSVEGQPQIALAALTSYTEELFGDGFECVPAVYNACD